MQPSTPRRRLPEHKEEVETHLAYHAGLHYARHGPARKGRGVAALAAFDDAGVKHSAQLIEWQRRSMPHAVQGMVAALHRRASAAHPPFNAPPHRQAASQETPCFTCRGRVDTFLAPAARAAFA